MKFADPTVPFCVADTETTSADPLTCRMVEFACLLIRNGDGKASQTFVNPGIPIPPSSMAVHHIQEDDVADAPEHDLVLKQVRTLNPGGYWVAHSAHFDSSVLKMTDQPWICTERMAKHLHPEFDGHGLQVVRYSLGLLMPEMKDVTMHRAMADVQVCTAVFLMLRAELLLKWGADITVQEVITRLNEPCLIHRIPFGEHRGTTFETLSVEQPGLLDWILKKSDGYDGPGGPDCVYTAKHWATRRHGGGLF